MTAVKIVRQRSFRRLKTVSNVGASFIANAVTQRGGGGGTRTLA
ncbi:MAG: hypothetical protein E6007_03815 [Negativicoccus succinicivorans]|nr:hypothetical protein [Negativicoccus succinicivorans]